MHRRDVVGCGGHFSRRGAGPRKYRAPGACHPGEGSGEHSKKGASGTPELREDDFEAPPDEGSATPDLREDDFEAPPDEGSEPPDFREDDFETSPDGGAQGKPSTCAA
jgi:hypothetical protein